MREAVQDFLDALTTRVSHPARHQPRFSTSSVPPSSAIPATRDPNSTALPFQASSIDELARATVQQPAFQSALLHAVKSLVPGPAHPQLHTSLHTHSMHNTHPPDPHPVHGPASKLNPDSYYYLPHPNAHPRDQQQNAADTQSGYSTHGVQLAKMPRESGGGRDVKEARAAVIAQRSSSGRHGFLSVSDITRPPLVVKAASQGWDDSFSIPEQLMRPARLQDGENRVQIVRKSQLVRKPNAGNPQCICE